MTISTLFFDPGSFSEKEQIELKKLNNLINELKSRSIPEELADKIDVKIIFLNNLQDSQKGFVKKLKNIHQDILKWLEKELKFVPKNYYKNIWMPLGMSAFGLPIGLAIGSMYGASLDKKVEAEERVLKFSE